MATLHETTTSSAVEVTDAEAVQSLLDTWGVRPSNAVCEDGQFYLYGHTGFNAFPDDCADPQTAAFLHELQGFIVEDDEWEVQTVGNEKCRHPVVAYRYRVTPDAVYYSDLRTDEHRIDAEGHPISGEESHDVYAVVVHPPESTSDVVNVYGDREKAEAEVENLRSDNQQIAVAVKAYEVTL